MSAPAGGNVMSSDSTLLRRSADGDHAAFRTLMDRHAASVYRFLESLGAVSDELEDVLQECFVSAWRGAATYRGSDSARGWLFAIARNALTRQHRRRVGEPGHMESLEELGVHAGWGGSHDFTALLDAQDELEWALRQLPGEEREVVALRDLDGFTGEETAEALGLSIAAMKSRLHRGRLRLMAVLRGTEKSNARS